MSKSKSRNVFIAVCISPAIILFTIFMALPTFEVFRMSLYNWADFQKIRNLSD
ncbi:hypothetical protein [Virgibacillus soli]|uniref:Sugar ABC transporter permease n=1 Tax=Paracerasibacillus soli TaxID=480284 RepID=A0ABU5CUX4_9BACI|nr:hypothetical protein [Virgibacillus soli]MDY0409240.1 hypothetical protein [Virgibacillus soli]